VWQGCLILAVVVAGFWIAALAKLAWERWRDRGSEDHPWL
jgi:hypothetical protein